MGEHPFAAGFLAMMRLRSVGEIRPEFFHAIEHKRSWLAVCEHLASRRAVIDQNPQWRDLAGHLARASDDVTRLQGFLGQDPQGCVAIMRSVAEKAESARKVRLWVGVVATALAVPSVAIYYVGPIILIPLAIFHVRWHEHAAEEARPAARGSRATRASASPMARVSRRSLRRPAA